MQKFRLARSARSQPLMGFSRVSGKFLVGINRHEQDHKILTSVTNIIKDTVYRQRRRSWGWGGGAAVAPPPPNENIGGGQTYRFAPQ